MSENPNVTIVHVSQTGFHGMLVFERSRAICSNTFGKDSVLHSPFEGIHSVF